MTEDTNRGLDVSPPVRVRERVRPIPQTVELPEVPTRLTRPVGPGRGYRDTPHPPRTPNPDARQRWDHERLRGPSPTERAEAFMNAARSMGDLPDDDADFGRALDDEYDDLDHDGMTPAERLRAIHRARGSTEAKQYAFKLLQQLMQRHTSHEQMARIFNVSARTITNWKSELKRLMGDEVARIDLNVFIGDSLAMYSEVTRMALAECSTRITPSQKANYMRIVAYAQGKQDNLLLGFGVTSQKQYRPEEDDKPAQDAHDIFKAVKNAIDGVFELGDAVPRNEQRISLLR